MKTKHLTRAIILISMAASSPAAFAEDAVAEKPKMELKDTVQPGSLTATIADSATFSTLTKALKAAELDVDGDKIDLDGSKVFSADVTANNGIMHTLGKVLVPKSLEGFAGLDK